jgi:ATP-dependent phosphoenolpyruvate carboxykinase
MRDKLITAGFFSALALLLIVLFVLAYQQSQEWKQFKQDHHCRIVGKMDGDVVVGFGTSSSGSMVTTVSTTDDKTGWLCDDGITYWK